MKAMINRKQYGVYGRSKKNQEYCNGHNHFHLIQSNPSHEEKAEPSHGAELSPTIVPTNVVANPTRKPVNSSGIVAGNSIVRSIVDVFNPCTRAVFIKTGLMLRTAFIVNKAIGTIP